MYIFQEVIFNKLLKLVLYEYNILCIMSFEITLMANIVFK